MTVPAVMTTYFEQGEAGLKRARCAMDTAVSWAEHASIDRVIVADDASDPDNYAFFVGGMEALFGNGLMLLPSPEPHGVGGSLNRGMKAAFTTDDICLYAVDDWQMLYDYHLDPWVDIFKTEDDIGCIRLGPPHPGLRGVVRHLQGDQRPWLLELAQYGYAVAQRPALWHKRFFDRVGWWREDCSALECERELADRWAITDALSDALNGTPTIALALPHPWYHVNPSELSAVDPRGRSRGR